MKHFKFLNVSIIFYDFVLESLHFLITAIRFNETCTIRDTRYATTIDEANDLNFVRHNQSHFRIQQTFHTTVQNFRFVSVSASSERYFLEALHSVLNILYSEV